MEDSLFGDLEGSGSYVIPMDLTGSSVLNEIFLVPDPPDLSDELPDFEPQVPPARSTLKKFTAEADQVLFEVAQENYKIRLLQSKSNLSMVHVKDRFEERMREETGNPAFEATLMQVSNRFKKLCQSKQGKRTAEWTSFKTRQAQAAEARARGRGAQLQEMHPRERQGIGAAIEFIVTRATPEGGLSGRDTQELLNMLQNIPRRQQDESALGEAPWTGLVYRVALAEDQRVPLLPGDVCALFIVKGLGLAASSTTVSGGRFVCWTVVAEEGRFPCGEMRRTCSSAKYVCVVYCARCPVKCSTLVKPGQWIGDVGVALEDGGGEGSIEAFVWMKALDKHLLRLDALGASHPEVEVKK